MEIAFIPDEEKRLREQFGEEFDTYRKKVGRWL
jgi:protein-S-isoprenylcysteine O-methyltransferase Ste14